MGPRGAPGSSGPPVSKLKKLNSNFGQTIMKFRAKSEERTGSMIKL